MRDITGLIFENLKSVCFGNTWFNGRKLEHCHCVGRELGLTNQTSIDKSARSTMNRKNNLQYLIKNGSSVGEWIYPTVCTLRGPGHDSSVGEWMYLTVCSRHGADSIPSHGRVFQGLFPWLITRCQPAWASEAENGSISPQWHHTNCGQWGGRPKLNYEQIWLKF